MVRVSQILFFASIAFVQAAKNHQEYATVTASSRVPIPTATQTKVHTVEAKPTTLVQDHYITKSAPAQTVTITRVIPATATATATLEAVATHVSNEVPDTYIRKENKKGSWWPWGSNQKEIYHVSHEMDTVKPLVADVRNATTSNASGLTAALVIAALPVIVMA